MPHTIRLRIVGSNRNGYFHFICLETDIAISAESLIEAKSKMRDALLSYFKSFSPEEMESGKYIRKTPFKYKVFWHVLQTIGFVKKIAFFFNSFADYDPQNQHLKLA